MHIKKVAIIIIGPVCSGKTTLCNELHKDLNIDYLNENNSKNLFGILNSLSNLEETIIIEHAEIIKYIEVIKKKYSKIIAIYLDVSSELLISNYYFRIKNGYKGDFENIDISEMKQEIDNLVERYQFENILKVEIENKLDYENKYNIIKQFILDNLKK